MSKAAKQSILILVILVLISLGFGVFTFLEKQKAESQNAVLQTQASEAEKRENSAVKQIKDLKVQIEKLAEERAQLQTNAQKAEGQVAELNTKLNEVSEDRDKWKRRIDDIRKERDELMTSLKNAQLELKERPEKVVEKIVYKEKESSAPQMIQPAVVQAQTAMAAQQPAERDDFDMGMDSDTEVDTNNERYWAGVLKQKASLEVKIQAMDKELSERSIEIVELKQDNANFKLQLENLKAEHEKVKSEIKYKRDMVNNLSLELARTKNDKKFISDQVSRLNDENANLRQEMKQLVASKGALEKSIVRLTQDKNTMSRQIEETENIIQSKIDEIWDIKESIDHTFEASQFIVPTSDVELPPIVVSSSGQGQGGPPVFNSNMQKPGFDGKVVNVNADNNFVIVNIGQSSGIAVGDNLSVYRDSKYIARLEVIQVRGDISAADIKDQWSKVQVGDIIR